MALPGLQRRLRASRPPFPHLHCSSALHSSRNLALPAQTRRRPSLVGGGSSLDLNQPTPEHRPCSLAIPSPLPTLLYHYFLTYASFLRVPLDPSGGPSLGTQAPASFTCISHRNPESALSGHLHPTWYHPLACLSRPAHLSICVGDQVEFD